MAWGQVIIAFILGAFLGPWIMSKFAGRQNANAG